MVKPLAETFYLPEPPAGFTRAPESPPADEGWSRKLTDRLYEGPIVAILTAVDQEGGIAPIPPEEFYKPLENITAADGLIMIGSIVTSETEFAEAEGGIHAGSTESLVPGDTVPSPGCNCPMCSALRGEEVDAATLLQSPKSHWNFDGWEAYIAKLPPVEWRDVQARRGVIDLLYTTIETQPHIVAKILGAGIVVRAEAHFTERAIRYEIMSPLLPPVPVGEVSPRYAAYFDGIDECVRFASI